MDTTNISNDSISGSSDYILSLIHISQNTPYLSADIQLMEEAPVEKTPRGEALIRRMQNLFERYIQNFKQVRCV